MSAIHARQLHQLFAQQIQIAQAKQCLQLRNVFVQSAKACFPISELAFHNPEHSDLLHDSTHWDDVILRHWHSDNRPHWVSDETLGEDRSRIRCSSDIFALLRFFALNIIHFNDESDISDALYRNALNFERLWLTEESSIEQH